MICINERTVKYKCINNDDALYICMNNVNVDHHHHRNSDMHTFHSEVVERIPSVRRACYDVNNCVCIDKSSNQW